MNNVDIIRSVGGRVCLPAFRFISLVALASGLSIVRDRERKASFRGASFPEAECPADTPERVACEVVLRTLTPLPVHAPLLNDDRRATTSDGFTSGEITLCADCGREYVDIEKFSRRDSALLSFGCSSVLAFFTRSFRCSLITWLSSFSTAAVPERLVGPAGQGAGDTRPGDARAGRSTGLSGGLSSDATEPPPVMRSISSSLCDDALVNSEDTSSASAAGATLGDAPRWLGAVGESDRASRNAEGGEGSRYCHSSSLSPGVPNVESLLVQFGVR